MTPIGVNDSECVKNKMNNLKIIIIMYIPTYILILNFLDLSYGF